MTKQISINIKERDGKAKVVDIQKELLAVFYGPQEDATSIVMDAREFGNVWKQAGESTIVVLKGVGEDKEVLIKDVQWHPLHDNPIHVDFYVIERGKLLTVSVPFEFVGEAPAEKLGGNVNKNIHELEIEVRPSEIPQNIVVNLEELTEMDSTITVADLDIPESAVPTGGTEEVVASVTIAVEEDLTAPVGDAVSEEDIEVEEGEGEEQKEDVDTEKTEG